MAPGHEHAPVGSAPVGRTPAGATRRGSHPVGHDLLAAQRRAGNRATSALVGRSAGAVVRRVTVADAETGEALAPIDIGSAADAFAALPDQVRRRVARLPANVQAELAGLPRGAVEDLWSLPEAAQVALLDLPLTLLVAVVRLLAAAHGTGAVATVAPQVRPLLEEPDRAVDIPPPLRRPLGTLALAGPAAPLLLPAPPAVRAEPVPEPATEPEPVVAKLDPPPQPASSTAVPAPAPAVTDPGTEVPGSQPPTVEDQAKAPEPSADDLWRATATELVDGSARLRKAVGAPGWDALLPAEQANAVAQLEQRVPRSNRAAYVAAVRGRAKKTKTRSREEHVNQLVEEAVGAEAEAEAKAIASSLKDLVAQRLLEARIQAARAAPPLTQADLLDVLEYGHGEFFFPALAKGLVTVHHKATNWTRGTYRSQQEIEDKKRNQYGPFSRRYDVQVHGFGPSGTRYEWAKWVIHVHFRSTQTPTVIDWVHKKRSGKGGELGKDHVQMSADARHLLDPLLVAAIDKTEDQASNVKEFNK